MNPAQTRARISARRRWVSQGPCESVSAARLTACARCDPTRLSVPVTKVRLTACAPTRESALLKTPIAKLTIAMPKPVDRRRSCVRPMIAASVAATKVKTRRRARRPRGPTNNAPANVANEEEQDRQRRRRRRAKLALGGLVAGLGRIAAHERDEDSIGDDAVGVDEARDRGEKSGQPRLVSGGGAQRARAIAGKLGFGDRGAGRGRLQDFVSQGRPPNRRQPDGAAPIGDILADEDTTIERAGRRKKREPAAAPETRRPALAYSRP